MKNNIPAFPSQELQQDYYGPMREGMTIRDYFAGQIIVGMYASTKYNDATYREMAEFAYSQADAMMEAKG